jgi:hypothetical protein
MPKASKVVTVSLVVGMLLGLAPPRAHADWDNPGGLPGIVSGKKIVIIGAAAGAGVVALYMLRKSRKDKSSVPDPAATQGARTGSHAFGLRAVDTAVDQTEPSGGPTTAELVRGLRADARFDTLFQSGARTSDAATRIATVR